MHLVSRQRPRSTGGVVEEAVVEWQHVCCRLRCPKETKVHLPRLILTPPLSHSSILIRNQEFDSRGPLDMFALSFPVSGLWVYMSLQRRRCRAWHSWWESERRLKQVSTVDSPPIRLGRLSLPTASVWNQLPRCILLFILFQDQECHLHIYMCDGFFHPISFFWALHPSAHDSWHISCVVVALKKSKKNVKKY